MPYEPDLSIVELSCPGCGEQVHDAPPLNYVRPDAVPMFSHLDGTALCMDRHGIPAEPVEHQKPQLRTSPVVPS
jgi:hypothetical protein